LFLNRLDNSIKSIYRANLNLILCGDINIDYLTKNDRKRQLDSVLQTYNLTANHNLTWDCVFSLNNNPDVDTSFSSFLYNYLRIFYNHFPQRKCIKRHNHILWITPGIKISCKHKRFLYLCTRSSNDISLKKYYKQYCKILASVIKEAKKYI